MYVCPNCKLDLKIEIKKSKKFLKCKNNNCGSYSEYFPFIGNIPILLPFGKENCIFKKEDILDKLNAGYKRRIKSKKKNILKNKLRDYLYGRNEKILKNFRNLILYLDKTSKILIIGGGSIGLGMDEFMKYIDTNNIRNESLDIYDSENINVIADAHFLPYKNNTFNMVIIQAVLHHCIEPEMVVAEINRVLKKGGIVYSETPFLQSVHEGAYDFTRYTHSGHRWLFKEFDEIDSGVVAGLFQSSLFVISYAISGIFRNRNIGTIIRILFSRIFKFLDSLTPEKFNIDNASCCYFIGKKIVPNKKRTDEWIAKYYSGSQV